MTHRYGQLEADAAVDSAVDGPVLKAFGRAVATSRGYREWLADQKIDPLQVTNLEQVPFLVKRDVFSGDVQRWMVGERLADAAELLTSSGRGGMFSIGASTAADLDGAAEMTDFALRGLGASEQSPSLLMNCLPMGINVPTTLATVATPSVHLEMAQEVYERLGPEFDRVIVLAEPLFLKELAEQVSQAHGGPWLAAPTICVVGGEWVAESLRSYIVGKLGGGPFGDPVVLVSMGAAELGLNMLFETPELIALRMAIQSNAGLREGLFPGATYAPSLFTFDPTRFHVEARRHRDGTRTLAVTPLGDGLIPLVRYDLGDLIDLVDVDAANGVLAQIGLGGSLTSPPVAFWGRQGDGTTIGTTDVRPEQVKDVLFAASAVASKITGRFFVEAEPHATVHIELRSSDEASDDVSPELERLLSQRLGIGIDVTAHRFGTYPFHTAGDFQHKPRYHG